MANVVTNGLYLISKLSDEEVAAAIKLKPEIEIRTSDRQLLRAMLISGSRHGDEAKELAIMCGCSVQRIIAIAKRYKGRKFKGGCIGYIGPSSEGSWAKDSPGIANPRHGISGRIPATIFIDK
jgi:hypothetical protein